MRLVQLEHPSLGRRVARVEGETLVALAAASVYELATGAAAQRETGEHFDYGEIYEGRSPWRLLPPIDHPEPARCLVTGTGLTHRKSAQGRNAMHAAGAPAGVTDSMRMYEWGVEGGSPPPGQVGTPPEWFYKGCGTIVRAHNEPLTIPDFALDGGEEAEIAGVYLIDVDGRPVRLGFTQGNEFSDHRFERLNYLYLAPSKLRDCSLGPELAVTASFADIRGEAQILRAGEVVWSRPQHTGEAAMCHTLANLEHHHFKYPAHRRPGDIHVHFFGAGAFSFSDGIELQDGDVMKIAFEGMGKPLVNPVRLLPKQERLLTVRPWL